jgi:methylenetetrahydrofolate dehydrogenase (NADP+)/methenyltetrahydrofolate cyclohydrolase
MKHPSTPQLLAGKLVADNLLGSIKNQWTTYKNTHTTTQTVPGLAVVQVGSNSASQVYVNKKAKVATELGFHSEIHRLPVDTTKETLLACLEDLNTNPNIHGILLQLPLPNHLKASEFQAVILPEKDVDGFHPHNLGLLLAGQPPFALPCTPAGVMRLLAYYSIPLKGKHAVVVGRSNIVGKPMAQLLLQADATVTICHSKTPDIETITRQADILVVAIGMPHWLHASAIKPSAVVIDVGINRHPQTQKLVGDVHFDTVSIACQAITPVPGGVGLMTIAELMHNTWQLFLASQQKAH